LELSLALVHATCLNSILELPAIGIHVSGFTRAFQATLSESSACILYLVIILFFEC
jgi:hypothetical protein